MEQGVCYTDKQYAYLKIAPSGFYTATMTMFDEFGSVVYCLKSTFFVRKAPKSELASDQSE